MKSLSTFSLPFYSLKLVKIEFFWYICSAMDKIKISASKRDPSKKPGNLAKEGIIPSVVYDQKGNSTSIEIDNPKIQTILAQVTPTTLIELTVDSADPIQVLVKEVFTNPRTGLLHHISFMALDQSKKAVLPVAIDLTGESPAVRNNLGVLLFTKQFIELKGFPKDIPASIPLDISSLTDVGNTLSVADLDIPDSLGLLHKSDKNLAVVTIRPFQKAEEVETTTEEEEGEGEELAEGEVAGEGHEKPETGEDTTKEER